MTRRPVALRLVLAAAAALAVTLPAVISPSAPAAADGDTAVYVVRMRGVDPTPSAVTKVATAMVADDGGTLRRTYYAAIQAFSVSMTQQQYVNYLNDSRVSSITRNRTYHVADVQRHLWSWGLDRIDQTDLPLDHLYHYPNTAADVHVYVLDTGVRASHEEFGGRVHAAYDSITGAHDAGTDCNGHGTGVAAAIAGRHVGVAKRARIESVRTFDCDGNGTMEQIMSAVDWVDAHAQKPAVVNLSFSGPAGSVLDFALYDMTQQGIAYTAAAGNGAPDRSAVAGAPDGSAVNRASDGSAAGSDGKAVNACTTTPARQTTAITVSTVDRSDTRPDWANYGYCVHLFAPGTDIVTAGACGDHALTVMTGTSMSAAEATGVAAMYLSAHPGTSPEDLDAALAAAATPDHVQNADGSSDPGDQTKNLLLHTAA